MAAVPRSGYLVLADLTGYTSYLSNSEIEHAPVIAGDLLETIVGRLEPPFGLAKLGRDGEKRPACDRLGRVLGAA
jgi:hypothetical protein